MTNLESTENIRILLVDDQEDMRQALRCLLSEIQGLNLDLCLAASGKEAIQWAETHDFALIILDVQMPDMNGFETAQKLHQLQRAEHTPIIFITASSRDGHLIAKGYQMGAVDYLFKPVQETIFLSKVKVFLDLYQQRQIIQKQAQELNQKMAEMERLTQMLTAANVALQEKTEKLEALATRDGLTEIANRRYFENFYQREWQRCWRNQEPLSLVMIDIDDFKAYNDYYGHLKGDECLKQVAKLIAQGIRRPTDLAARYGGEEFVLILSNTLASHARRLVQSIYNQLKNLAIPHADSRTGAYLTLSSGIAAMIPNHANQELLLSQADQALYQAKKQGRNQIICFKEESC